MVPSLTIVVLGTDGSSRSRMLAMMPTGCAVHAGMFQSNDQGAYEQMELFQSHFEHANISHIYECSSQRCQQRDISWIVLQANPLSTHKYVAKRYLSLKPQFSAVQGRPIQHMHRRNSTSRIVASDTPAGHRQRPSCARCAEGESQTWPSPSSSPAVWRQRPALSPPDSPRAPGTSDQTYTLASWALHYSSVKMRTATVVASSYASWVAKYAYGIWPNNV